MPIKRIKEYLNQKKVKYDIISHPVAYTAQGVAHTTHISGKEVAKTLVVKIDGEMVMVVLPAPYKIDFELLKQAMGARKVELATEEEFWRLFPDCAIGAMPPFGNLYGLKVLIEKSLEADEEIVFNAGNHREVIKMAFKDFDDLVKPRHLDFSFMSSR